MLTLKRGIGLWIETGETNRLRYGSLNRLTLGARPITLWVTLAGGFDKGSGFVVNVCDIDNAVEEDLDKRPVSINDVGELFGWFGRLAQDRFPQQTILELSAELDDTLCVRENCEDKAMLEVTRKYELAAAHRLINPEWDEARNKAVFGKCNNTEGHGHNYTVDVSFTGPRDPQTGEIMNLDAMDATVKEVILDRFDHKNLNKETKEFARLNPTVENMAKVFWDLLVDEFEPVQLTRIGVWETPRTYAEYSGLIDVPLQHSDHV